MSSKKSSEQNYFSNKVFKLFHLISYVALTFLGDANHFFSFLLLCMYVGFTGRPGSFFLFDDPFKMFVHHHYLSDMRFDT